MKGVNFLFFVSTSYSIYFVLNGLVRGTKKNCFENGGEGAAVQIFCIYGVQLVQVEYNYLIKFSTSNEFGAADIFSRPNLV